jgi:hypothetical protein
MTENTTGKGQPWKIVSIERSEAPSGTEGTDWYAYVIEQGEHTSNGYRRGKLKAVTLAVEELIFQLNERRFGKRGRVNLVPTPKKTVAKPS